MSLREQELVIRVYQILLEENQNQQEVLNGNSKFNTRRGCKMSLTKLLENTEDREDNINLAIDA